MCVCVACMCACMYVCMCSSLDIASYTSSHVTQFHPRTDVCIDCFMAAKVMTLLFGVKDLLYVI